MNDAVTLVVGVGSDHGDDQLGWLLADWLKDCAPPGVCVRKARTPLQLLDWLTGVSCLVVVDACRGSGQPGDIQRFTWPDVPAWGRAFAGTHDLGLLEALRLAETLGSLPARVVVWGVTAPFQSGRYDAGLSPALEGAFPRVYARLQAEFAPAPGPAAQEPSHA
jgi:hydrogenase maturation protease